MRDFWLKTKRWAFWLPTKIKANVVVLRSMMMVMVMMMVMMMLLCVCIAKNSTVLLWVYMSFLKL